MENPNIKERNAEALNCLSNLRRLRAVIGEKMGGKYCAYCGVPRPHPHANDCIILLVNEEERLLESFGIKATEESMD